MPFGMNGQVVIGFFGPEPFRRYHYWRYQIKAKESHHNHIIDGLYLGAYPCDGDLNDILRDGHNSCLIVSVVSESEYDTAINKNDPLYGKMDTPIWKMEGQSDFESLHVKQEDCGSELQNDVISQAVEAIDRKIRDGGKVYVHCNVGHGRSWMIVMCYLMEKRGMSYVAAAEFIKHRRSCVAPNQQQQDRVKRYIVERRRQLAPCDRELNLATLIPRDSYCTKARELILKRMRTNKNETGNIWSKADERSNPNFDYSHLMQEEFDQLVREVLTDYCNSFLHSILHPGRNHKDQVRNILQQNYANGQAMLQAAFAIKDIKSEGSLARRLSYLKSVQAQCLESPENPATPSQATCDTYNRLLLLGAV